MAEIAARNFAHQKDIFQTAIECFGSGNEGIRSAAAFAVGMSSDFYVILFS